MIKQENVQLNKVRAIFNFEHSVSYQKSSWVQKSELLKIVRNEDRLGSF
jgi:hypothetical protein